MLPTADLTDPSTAPGLIPMLTIHGTIETSGQTISHLQYATSEFVVTEVGRSIILHSTRLGGRFVVDRTNRVLRRVDAAAQALQVAHLREMVGAVTVHADPETIEVDGFQCRRYRLCNDSTRIVVAAEAYCARVPLVRVTAIHAEREFEANLHPFALPLDPDELVIRSVTRTYANGFQHMQSYRLDSVVPDIANLAAQQALLAYQVADGGA